MVRTCPVGGAASSVLASPAPWPAARGLSVCASLALAPDAAPGALPRTAALRLSQLGAGFARLPR